MDRIVETVDGFDCTLNGRRFGSWRSRAEALAGLEVERRRLVALVRRTREAGPFPTLGTEDLRQLATYGAFDHLPASRRDEFRAELHRRDAVVKAWHNGGAK